MESVIIKNLPIYDQKTSPPVNEISKHFNNYFKKVEKANNYFKNVLYNRIL